MRVKDLLLEQMIATYSQNNWFVALENAIKSISPENAAWKTETSNSIWGIVKHITFWNRWCLNRFKDIPLPELTENSETFTVENDRVSEDEWNKSITELQSVMNEWISSLKECKEEKLYELYNKDDNWAQVIANMNIHTAYHIGQIVEIQKINGIWDPELGVK